MSNDPWAVVGHEDSAPDPWQPLHHETDAPPKQVTKLARVSPPKEPKPQPKQTVDSSGTRPDPALLAGLSKAQHAHAAAMAEQTKAIIEASKQLTGALADIGATLAGIADLIRNAAKPPASVAATAVPDTASS